MRICAAERTLCDALLAVYGCPLAEVVHCPRSVRFEVVRYRLRLLLHLLPCHAYHLAVRRRSVYALGGCTCGSGQLYRSLNCVVVRCGVLVDCDLCLQRQRRLVHYRTLVCQLHYATSVRLEHFVDVLRVRQLAVSIKADSV